MKFQNSVFEIICRLSLWTVMYVQKNWQSLRIILFVCWLCCLICIHTKLSFNYFWFEVSLSKAKSNIFLFFSRSSKSVKTRSAWSKNNQSLKRETSSQQSWNTKVTRLSFKWDYSKEITVDWRFRFQIISCKQVHYRRRLKIIREKKNWLDFIWRVFA